MERHLRLARRFCSELLLRRKLTPTERADVELALGALEAEPVEGEPVAVEIGIVEEHDQDHEAWVLQVYGSLITLTNGGSEWSHGHDHYTRYNFGCEGPHCIAMGGEVKAFESVFLDMEWDGFKHYVHNHAPKPAPV